MMQAWTDHLGLVRGVGRLPDIVRGIASRLDCIEGGLAGEDPNVKGAELAQKDAKMVVLDLVDDVEKLPDRAREAVVQVIIEDRTAKPTSAGGESGGGEAKALTM